MTSPTLADLARRLDDLESGSSLTLRRVQGTWMATWRPVDRSRERSVQATGLEAAVIELLWPEPPRKAGGTQ